MENEAVTFARNAKGVREMLSIKYDTLDFKGEWYDAFGTPERKGVWLIWGNSANGKTSFALKLCKELCRFGRVAYDSLEEGACLSMQEAIRRENMIEVNKRFLLIDNEDMNEAALPSAETPEKPRLCGDRQFSVRTDEVPRVYQVQGKAQEQAAHLHQPCRRQTAQRTRRQKCDVRRLAENLCGRLPRILQGKVQGAEGILRYRAGKGGPLLGRPSETLLNE